MSVLQKIVFFQNRRDEVPTQMIRIKRLVKKLESLEQIHA
jgi:hypothetical protein